jgi:hypothetical protein
MMMDSIFQLSESQETGNELNEAEPASSQPSFPADESRRLRQQVKAATSGDCNPIPSPEDVTASEALREQIQNDKRKFERQFENLRRYHAEQLAILKQENLSKEQTAATSYNLEYRDAIVATTLKYLGIVILTEDIGSLLRQRLNEEEFKFEKELLDLQQVQDDELAQLRSAIRPVPPGRKHRPHTASINPFDIAHMVYGKLSETEPEEPSQSEILEHLIRILQTAKMSLLSAQAPRLATVDARGPPPSSIPKSRRPQNGPDGNDREIEQYVVGRKKLMRTLAKVNRLTQNLGREKAQ